MLVGHVNTFVAYAEAGHDILQMPSPPSSREAMKAPLSTAFCKAAVTSSVEAWIAVMIARTCTPSALFCCRRRPVTASACTDVPPWPVGAAAAEATATDGRLLERTGSTMVFGAGAALERSCRSTSASEMAQLECHMTVRQLQAA